MFNFSLDSLLLGYFAPVSIKTKKIIDFGTGNAPIPLYLTLRTDALIEAVEIQEDVFRLADKSVKMNNFENQITLYNRDLIGIHKEVGVNCYDLVTCNPPFFKHLESSNINKTEYKTIARHEVKLKLEDILIEAKKVLKNKGYLAMVYRPDRLAELMGLLRQHSLEPKSLRMVYPSKGTNANGLIIIAQKGANAGMKVLEPIFVHKGEEYTKIVREVFYLKKTMI